MKAKDKCVRQNVSNDKIYEKQNVKCVWTSHFLCQYVFTTFNVIFQIYTNIHPSAASAGQKSSVINLEFSEYLDHVEES